MIEFGNFYQLIAKNHLSHWLETLPAQIAARQREQQHGLFKQWSNAVEFLPEITPGGWIYCTASRRKAKRRSAKVS